MGAKPTDEPEESIPSRVRSILKVYLLLADDGEMTTYRRTDGWPRFAVSLLVTQVS